MDVKVLDLLNLVKTMTNRYKWDIDESVDAFVMMLEHFNLSIISEDISDWMLRKQLTFILSEELLK